MDLIIIFFVLYMIFSMLTRAFRTAAAQRKQFPPVADPDLSRGEDRQLPDEPEAFPWQEFLFPEESAFPDDSERQPEPAAAIKRDASPQQRPERVGGADPDTGWVLPRPMVPSRPGFHEKRTSQPISAGPGAVFLLKKENLPRAIIAAVVLGAPRSKDPLSCRIRRDRH